MAQRIRMHRSQAPLWILAALLFIAVGDIIPGPIGKTSLQVRRQLETSLTNAFQVWHPKNNPYNRTERQIGSLQKY
jgi:hypothetical protein